MYVNNKNKDIKLKDECNRNNMKEENMMRQFCSNIAEIFQKVKDYFFDGGQAMSYINMKINFTHAIILFTWMVVVWLVVKFSVKLPLGGFILGVYILSIPLILSFTYQGSVHRISTLNMFSHKGRVYRLLSGHWFRIIISILLAWGSMVFVIVQLYTCSELEWFIFFLTVPIFIGVYKLFEYVLKKELKRYVLVSKSILWSSCVVPVIMVFLYYFVLKYFMNIPSYASLDEAIEVQKNLGSGVNRSLLLYELFQWMAIYNGIKVYIISSLKQFGGDILPVLCYLVGGWWLFFNACEMFACFLIPINEYSRILTLSNSEQPELPNRRDIVNKFLVVIFITVFIYVSIFVFLESLVKPEIEMGGSISNNFRNNFEKGAIVIDATIRAEIIANDIYKEGTIAMIEELDKEASKGLEEARNQLKSQIEQMNREANEKIVEARNNLRKKVINIFNGVEPAVDAFLDGYYTLRGDYTRLCMLVTGNLENYLSNKLREKLEEGHLSENLQIAIADFEDTYNNVSKDLQNKIDNSIENTCRNLFNKYNPMVQEVLLENKIIQTDVQLEIVRTVKSLDEIIEKVDSLKNIFNITKSLDNKLNQLVDKDDLLQKNSRFLSIRLGTTGGTILTMKKVSDVAVAKIIDKIIAKGTFKVAANTIIKAAVKTATKPFSWTIALVVGLGIEKAGIELEEYLYREEYKKQIMDAIQQVKAEIEQELFNNSNGESVLQDDQELNYTLPQEITPD